MRLIGHVLRRQVESLHLTYQVGTNFGEPAYAITVDGTS